MTRTLYRGGRIYSRADPFATALLVDGPVIAWLGADAAADVSVADEVVDLGDRLVTPAFVDAHVHATSTGLALDGLDLSTATSVTDVLERVSLHCRSRPGAAVVLGTGWDESRWMERRPPTAAELDRAADGRAVYLSRVDVHSAVVSSALLRRADPATRGWQADGWVRTEAHHEVRRVAYASVDAGQREQAQRRARGHAASLGVGCLHEMAGPDISGEHDLAALLALAEVELGPEVIGYWAAAGDVDTPRRLGLRGGAGDLFVDGAVGSRTAALHAPYADAPDTAGHLWLDADAVAAHVVACVEAGLQPGFHVIGDRAIDTALDGLDQAAAQVGRHRVRAVRPRFEHAELLSTATIARMADLGVYASVQPMFDALWGGPAGMYVDRLGAERAAAMNPFAALAAAGVPIAAGSDAPVTAIGPWAAVKAAMHHRTPTHRLSARAAFAAHTRGGWRAAGIDDVGELVPGAPASLAVWEAGELIVQVPDERVTSWSTDPRAATPGLPDLDPDAPDPVCLRTVVRGTTAYDAGALS